MLLLSGVLMGVRGRHIDSGFHRQTDAQGMFLNLFGIEANAYR